MKIAEGPACALSSANVVEVFSADTPPVYPAIMFYNPATDEPYWVECHDKFTIQLATIKNSEADRLIEGLPQPTPLVDHAPDWSARLFDAISSRGITFHYTEPLHDGSHIGTQIEIDGVVRSISTQLHADCSTEPRDIQPTIDALADGIANKLGEQKDLYCCQLWLPNKGAEAVALERGNMRARALRAICGQWDGQNNLIGAFPVTRIDILFPVWTNP